MSHCTHWTGGWLNPTASLNVSEMRKISGSNLGLKRDCSTRQPNSYSLCWLSYPSSYFIMSNFIICTLPDIVMVIKSRRVRCMVCILCRKWEKPAVFCFKNFSGKYCLRMISGYRLEGEYVDWIALRYMVDFCNCSNEYKTCNEKIFLK